MLRSASGVIGPVVSVEVLLAGFGSEVADETVAVLTNGPPTYPGSTNTVRVTELAPPAVRPDASWHVTTCPEGEQLHPAPDADTKVSPPGRSSEVVTGPAASDGPLLVTASV